MRGVSAADAHELQAGYKLAPIASAALVRGKEVRAAKAQCVDSALRDTIDIAWRHRYGSVPRVDKATPFL